MSPKTSHVSSAAVWLRALELTAPIARQRTRTLPLVLAEVADRMGDAPALLSESECLTYRELAGRINQYARWALAQDLRRGDVVCLLMGNRPEYLAIWLGLTSVGVVVALLNTNLVATPLGHAIHVVKPRRIIVETTYLEILHTALLSLALRPDISVYELGRVTCAHAASEVLNIHHYAAEPLSFDERRSPEIEDLALFIYTSGTTGLPKAARVSHARLMQWSYWFAGIMETTKSDCMYDCLPMYHSVGGVQAPGALLVSGGSVVLREKFSAKAFWPDITRWKCTLFQYIGELCRYLLQEPKGEERMHELRLACGNGLAPEIWEAFQTRFQLPRMVEFYASTEGNVSLFNVTGKVGSIGHIPLYLRHRFSPPLVRSDSVTGELARDSEGFCIRCGDDEVGEALGRISEDPSTIGSRFEGYACEAESRQKVLRDVFERGDAWFRTGDLLRKDRQGYFYFIDRLGDTFRRKGENVSTLEVASAICCFPGVRHAMVYGVAVPHVESRVGMAALVVTDEFDLAGFRDHLAHALPSYARPMFVRLRDHAEVTSTLKYSKADLTLEGYDPSKIADPLYFNLPGSRAFIPLEPALHREIQSGRLRI